MEFDVVSAAGREFVPEKLSLNAARIGTDMCAIDVVAIREDGSRELLKGFQPVRSSGTPSFSTVELPLCNAGTGRSLKVRVYLYNMLANKQLALSDVKISGKVYTSESGIESIAAGSDAPVVTEYYDLAGRRVTRPLRGNIYVARYRDGLTKLVVF